MSEHASDHEQTVSIGPGKAPADLTASAESKERFPDGFIRLAVAEHIFDAARLGELPPHHVRRPATHSQRQG